MHLGKLITFGAFVGFTCPALIGCCAGYKSSVKDYGAALEDNARTLQAAIALCQTGEQAACERAKQSAKAIEKSAASLKQPDGPEHESN